MLDKTTGYSTLANTIYFVEGVTLFGTPSAPEFDPASLFGPSDQGVVYDIQDRFTLFSEWDTPPATFSTVSGPIGTILDKSGNDNHLLAKTEAERVSLVRDSNDLFAATATGLTIDAPAVEFAMNGVYTRISAIVPFTVPSVNRIFADPNAATGGSLSADGEGAFSLNNGGIVGPVSIPDDEVAVITEIVNTTSSKIAKNAEAYVTGTCGTVANSGLICFGSTAADEVSNAGIYRLVMIDRILADVEIAAVRQWCADGAGVTL